jgi:DNA-binding Lrp family transcriptional regulator
VGFAEAVQYLVVQRLVGSKALDAVEMYLNGWSPSEIASALGISRHTARSYIQRLLEKGVSGLHLPLLRRAIPYIRRLEPAVVNGRCLLCGAAFVFYGVSQQSVRTAIFNHMVSRHSDYVSSAVRDVIRRVLDEVVSRRGSPNS